MKRHILTSALLLAVLLTACGQNAGNGGQQAPDAGQENEPQATQQATDATSSDQTPDAGYLTDSIISNKFLQMTIPQELQGTTYALVDDEKIEIYDKAIVDSGFPGFVFSVGISSDCNVYSGGMYVKMGEIFGEDGTIYNVSKGMASEIQWDYNQPDVPDSYKKLENAADSIIESMTGVGNNMYVYKAGTKGEDLYFTVLDKYVTAVNEGWDAAKCETENISPEIAVMAANTENPFEKLGYAYVDINNDGIDDLFIGDMSGSELDGMVYDIYTMVDRAPAHVVSGTARDRYYGYNNFAVCNEFSGGAMENGSIISTITPNSTELFWQFAYKYDAYEDEKNPWFTAYNDEVWDPMTEEEYNLAMDRVSSEKMTIKYTPFTNVAGIDFSKADMSKYATFTQIVDSLYPNMAYANEKLGDTDVLLVANGSYDNLDGNQAAIDSSIFMYDKAGNIVYLGTVQSQGTANPLAVKGGKLYVAGHHFVTVYTVDGGKLAEDCSAYEEFDSAGNATYFHKELGDKDYTRVDDDKILQKLFDEYTNAKIINYDVISE